MNDTQLVNALGAEILVRHDELVAKRELLDDLYSQAGTISDEIARLESEIRQLKGAMDVFRTTE